LHPDLLAGLRVELDEMAEAVEAARGLRDYPFGQTSITIATNPLNTLLRYTQDCRQVGHLLALDILRRASEGDGDGALESVRACINAARSVGDEPFLISQLVRIAILAEAIVGLERTLGRTAASDEALAETQGLLLMEDEFPRLLVGLRGERAMMVAVAERLASGMLPLSALSGAGDTSPADEKQVNPLLYRHNQALFLERMTDDVEVARRPLHEQAHYWATYGDFIERHKQTNPQRVANTLYVLLSPATSNMYDSVRRASAKLRTAAVAVACERHRLRHGTWPEDLYAIDRDLLDHPPLDPYMGGGLSMSMTDPEGPRVYAWGKDEEDDDATFNDRFSHLPGFDVGFRLFHPEMRSAVALPEDPFAPAGDEGGGNP
jgi:hypothetical protein